MEATFKNQKTQATMEFILVFSLLLIFITLFIALVYSDMFKGTLKNEQDALDDMATFIQQELIIASKVETGYIRTFYLPEKIVNKNYDIVVGNYMLSVNTSRTVSFRGIPKVNTTGMPFIIPGNNSIVKNSSGIFIVQGSVS